MKIARRVATTLAAVAIAIAGCAAPRVATSTPGDGHQQTGVDEDGRFALRIHTPAATVRAGDAIAIDTQLAFLGPGAQVDVSGGAPLVGFGLEQVDGNLHLEPAFDDVCAHQSIALITPVVVPFAKTGGFTDTDPAAAFWHAYLADPQVRLPAGRWKVSAVTSFTEGVGCTGPAHHLDASVTIDVLP